jgi:hypothetical protein
MMNSRAGRTRSIQEMVLGEAQTKAAAAGTAAASGFVLAGKT